MTEAQDSQVENDTNYDGDKTKPYRVAPAISVRLAARTDVGQIREHNEDDLLVCDLSRKIREPNTIGDVFTVGQHGALIAVCDGMGGAAAGEIASNMAVNILYERMVEGLSDDRSVTRDELARKLVRSVETAGARIFQEARADRTRRGMGTTVTAAALVDDTLFLAQVGDSRGYVLRDGRLVQVTRDQSLVNQLIEAGQLTEEEAETFEHNNIILQALGTAESVQVDLTFVKLQRGDVLMLCSDGLSGMMRAEDMRFLLTTHEDPADACKALIDRANAAGGHDNVTVIVARFSGSGLTDVVDGEDLLRYRKYSLPDESPSEREARRSPMGFIPKTVPPPSLFSGGNPAPARPGQNLAHTIVQGLEPGDGNHGAARPDFSRDDDERVIVPGTHVPGWVVVLLVLLVMGILAGGAVILVR